MVRGKSVSEALSSLERTHKKGARLLEDLIRSAVANAENNEKQNADSLVIRTLTVNKAQTFHRGVPMARGRIRRMRKFLSHIELTLGIAGQEEVKKETKEAKETEETKEKKEKKTETASQKAAKPVQKTETKKSTSSTGKGSTKKTASSSKVSAAKKSTTKKSS